MIQHIIEYKWKISLWFEWSSMEWAHPCHFIAFSHLLCVEFLYQLELTVWIVLIIIMLKDHGQ